MKNLTNAILTTFVGMFIVIAGCTQQTDEVDTEVYNEGTMADSAMGSMEQHSMAVALIHSNNAEISGWISFTKAADGIQVHAELSGLSEGEHGIHIHKFGDCRADDYSSAGGHYNPSNEDHGAPTDSVRHMGDMGNIQANADGSATLDYVDSVIKINKIIGRGVIVHGGADDLTSQPSGAAGPRIACGVIGIANTGFMADTTDQSNM